MREEILKCDKCGHVVEKLYHMTLDSDYRYDPVWGSEPIFYTTLEVCGDCAQTIRDLVGLKRR